MSIIEPTRERRGRELFLPPQLSNNPPNRKRVPESLVEGEGVERKKKSHSAQQFNSEVLLPPGCDRRF